jgi:hypothetical protein
MPTLRGDLYLTLTPNPDASAVAAKKAMVRLSEDGTRKARREYEAYVHSKRQGK